MRKWDFSTKLGIKTWTDGTYTIRHDPKTGVYRVTKYGIAVTSRKTLDEAKKVPEISASYLMRQAQRLVYGIL